MFLIDTIPAFYYHRASPEQTSAVPRGTSLWSPVDRPRKGNCTSVRSVQAVPGLLCIRSEQPKGVLEASPEGIMMLSRKGSPLEPEGILFHEDNFLIAAALDHYAGEHPKKNTST